MFRFYMILCSLVLTAATYASQGRPNISVRLVSSTPSSRYTLKNPSPVSSTTSNPKNDVEIIGPLEGAPPILPPAPPPPFPPPDPDYPAGFYPYEPPFYQDPNGYPYNPYYPALPPAPAATEVVTAYPQTTRYTEPTTRYTEPTTRYTEPTTRYTEPTTRPTHRTTPKYRFTTKGTSKSPPKSYKPLTSTAAAKRATKAVVTPSYVYNPYPRRNSAPHPSSHPRPTIDKRNSYPGVRKNPLVPQAISPQFTNPAPLQPTDNEMYSGWELINSGWYPRTPSAHVVGSRSPLGPKYKLAILSNYHSYNETSGTFGFDIDLDDGLAVRIRGYRKDGKQILDGFFTLFTSDGNPVQITYTADNDEQTLIQNKTVTSVPDIPKKVGIENFTDVSRTEKTAPEWSS